MRQNSITVGGPKQAKNRAHALCSGYDRHVTVGVITPFQETFNAELTPDQALKYARHIILLAEKAKRNRRLLKWLDSK